MWMGPTIFIGFVDEVTEAPCSRWAMGQGAAVSNSRKFKMNTCNWTEMEFVASDMYMAEMLWILYFIQNQGYVQGKPDNLGVC